MIKYKNYFLGLIFTATLSIASAYGFFLILPLYIYSIGGNEIDVGNILFAGAIGTIICVGFCGKLMNYFKIYRVITLGALMYATAAIIFSLNFKLSFLLYFAGFLLGSGWGLTYTIGPILLSNLVEDKNRFILFSIISAFNALGMGFGPVVAQYLLKSEFSFNDIFIIASYLSIFSATLFYFISKKLLNLTVVKHEQIKGGEINAVFNISKSQARFPLIMVILGACIFSTMMNFQTTFAKSMDLNYSTFYIFYSISVISSRFFLSGYVSKFEPKAVTITLLIGMCFSIFLFLLLKGNSIIYGIASIGLGITYGLVYPIIQAQAVNCSDHTMRSRVLIYFSLAYFIGVYVFPLLAGYIIVHNGYQSLLIILLVLGILELLTAVLFLTQNTKKRYVK